MPHSIEIHERDFSFSPMTSQVLMIMVLFINRGTELPFPMTIDNYLLQRQKMATLIEDPSMRNRTAVFMDRNDGGRKLAEELLSFQGADTIILAIPSGGVPIGKMIQKRIGGHFDLLIVRKIQIPWNPEAGFGAINLDQEIIINEALLYALRIPEADVRTQIDKTRGILQARNRKFRKEKEFPDLGNRPVILADDGLASGYTMRAAIEFVKKRSPAIIIVAVPTGSSDTVKKILQEVDYVVCLNIRESYPFAVADAYHNWYDLDDEDVLQILETSP